MGCWLLVVGCGGCAGVWPVGDVLEPVGDVLEADEVGVLDELVVGSVGVVPAVPAAGLAAALDGMLLVDDGLLAAAANCVM